MDHLRNFENQGWYTLSVSRKRAREFYDSILRNDAVMVLPGGHLLDGKEAILNSFSDQPWDTHNITNPKIISLTEDTGIVVYRVTAKREGQEPYEALVSSTYVNSDDGWKLVHHQQSKL